MGRKIAKPPHRSAARDTLDGLVNKESMDMIDRMEQHRKIAMEDNYPADHAFTAKDIVDIDLAFLVQEIAGLKVLLRGDLAKTEIEYIDATPEDAASDYPPVDDNEPG